MSEADGKAVATLPAENREIGGASLTIGKIAAALSKAQGQIKSAVKDSKNPFFNSSYADLASVWETCRKPLSENGIAVIQRTIATDGLTIVLDTILAHESGEWISGTLTMKPIKNDPQGVGSCLTYARRYALSAIVGICPEDDDGNKASGKISEPAGKPAASDPQRKSEAQTPPPAQKAQDGAGKPPASPLTATGFVSEASEPNKGGYVSFTLEGVNRADGRPRKLSTRDEKQIATILDRRDAGEKVTMEYTENANTKFADSIIKVLESAPAGDAQA